MIWQRSYRPGAVEMEGRAYGAPERPEQAFLSETSSLAAPATANPHDSNRNTTLDDIEEAPEEAHSTRSDHVSYEAETAEATPVYKIELIADKPVDLDAHHWGGDVISAEALNFYDFVKSSPKWRRRIIVVILLSVAAVIASVVATTQAAQGAETVIQTGAPSVAPSSMPSFITEGILEAAEGLVRGEITPGTPQYDAVGWLSTIDGTSESLPNFKQRFVLVVFYFATGGDSWTNRADWLNPDLHECDWGTEVSCEEDPAGGRKVTILDDVRNNLRGSIPRELALLTNLETLILESNRLTGSLPEELFELTTLVTVNVARNQLTGRIPPNIGNDDNLATLDLHENMIGSSLPSSLFGLPLLTVLDLSKNVMTGTLSGGISELRTLKKLDLSNNRMSGRLPATVGNNVDIIHLDFNNFTGLIGTMMSPGQLEFTVAHNELTGTLPATLSVRNLTNLPSYRLQTVDLSHNFFEGRIPNNAGLISSLRTFDISSNELSGPIPSGENHWLNLEVFGASNNNLQGTVPFSISRRLSFLDLSNNDFRGGIPDDFEQHPTLEIFILHDNPNLGGTIPSFTDVSRDRLRDLDIESCGLTGTIPRSMYVLENLEIFKASDNNLGGSIPTTLGELSVLNTFHVDSNLLTGPIPDYFGDMFLLKSLHLANNDFRGMIPSSLAEVSTLASLTLSPGNPKLEGTIEQSTCDAVEENSGNSLGAELIGCTIQCECCSSRTQPEVCL
uniref:Leucine-rich repeat-containing N-terminal plant-type domain-containing protein n=1 Tax=Grammatophora oceanica TaxID=210454 RepID=A0A7S1V1J6_9STRA